MSRVGKKPISIPDGVTVTVDQQTVTVKGKGGELTVVIRPEVSVTVADGAVTLSIAEGAAHTIVAYWGLSRQLIANMIAGVTTGFVKKLEVNGVGYKVAVAGQGLVLQLGFSHPVNFPLPAGVTATVEGNQITVSGIDKQLIGQVAADIRKLRKPEPYKGKGIKYSDEVIRRKAGKTAKSGE